MFSVLLGIHLRVELQGHVVINSALNFLRKGQTVFHSGCSIYILTSRTHKTLYVLCWAIWLTYSPLIRVLFDWSLNSNNSHWKHAYTGREKERHSLKETLEPCSADCRAPKIGTYLREHPFFLHTGKQGQ